MRQIDFVLAFVKGIYIVQTGPVQNEFPNAFRDFKSTSMIRLHVSTLDVIVIVYGRTSKLLASANLMTLDPDLIDAEDDAAVLTRLREATDGVFGMGEGVLGVCEASGSRYRRTEGEVRVVLSLPLRLLSAPMGILSRIDALSSTSSSSSIADD